MARIDNLSNFLTDVASAIKEKKGSDSNIPAAKFDQEIRDLPSQGVYQTKSVEITTNGSKRVTPDPGFDAIEALTITTNVPTEDLSEVLDEQDRLLESIQNKMSEISEELDNKSGVLNIYCQREEPTSKNGLWIQLDDEYSEIVSELKITERKWDQDKMAKLKPVPYLIKNTASVTVDGYVYMFGSLENGNKQKAYKYNMQTDEYTALTDIPYEFGWGGCTIIGRDIYLIGSYFGSHKQNYKYNIDTDTYTQLSEVPALCEGNAAVAVGTDIFIFCGFGNSGGLTGMTYKYDTLTDTYERLADMPSGIYGSTISAYANFNNTSIAIGTDIFIFGGGTGGTACYAVLKYDTLTNKYTFPST